MRITAPEEYGLRCMLLFARAKPGESLTLPEISDREGLSIPYAGKLIMILKKAGLLKAVRGRNGGYILAQPPEKIRMDEIFAALGDKLYGPHHCDRYGKDNCTHNGDCRVGSIWSFFDNYIQTVLSKLTLADVADGKVDSINLYLSKIQEIN
jgi:Rrf2 family protein